MNREIKFRVWNESGQNMIFDIDNVFECLKQQLKSDGSMPDRGFVTPYDHYSEGMRWMQYTGLKDKNGVEIYEGDILQVNTTVKVYADNFLFDEDEDIEQEISCEVIYNEVIAGFDLSTIETDIHLKSWGFYGETESNEIEVIGNIYESKKASAEKRENDDKPKLSINNEP